MSVTWGNLPILRNVSRCSAGQPSGGGVLIADAGRKGWVVRKAWKFVMVETISSWVTGRIVWGWDILLNGWDVKIVKIEALG